LNGRRTRISFRLAQAVEVRLAEASPVTGGLVFHILQGQSLKDRPPRNQALQGQAGRDPVGRDKPKRASGKSGKRPGRR